MVSSQCSTYSFASIWHHHSTDSGDFQKTFGAYFQLLSSLGAGYGVALLGWNDDKFRIAHNAA
jgi:hypothetical protein